MCGQTGVAGNLFSTSGAIFRELLYGTQLRGVDSTGLACVFNTPSDKKVPYSFDLYKKPLTASDFLQMDWVHKAIESSSSMTALIGHTRAATVGNITGKNAHPFHSGRIILTHNGTLWGSGGLKEYDTTQSTDSANIARHMNEYGEKETLKGLTGAFSLVWFNLEKGTLNFARNGERPMFLAIEDKQRVYWASELEQLAWILRRNKITAEYLNPFPYNWIQFDVGNSGISKLRHDHFDKYVYAHPIVPSYKRTHTPTYTVGDEDVGDWRDNWSRKPDTSLSQFTKRQAICSTLKELGFSLRQETYMNFTDFKPHHEDHAGTGNIYGYIVEGRSWCDGAIFAITKDIFDKCEGKWAKVRIDSVRERENPKDKKREPEIICSFIEGPCAPPEEGEEKIVKLEDIEPPVDYEKDNNTPEEDALHFNIPFLAFKARAKLPDEMCYVYGGATVPRHEWFTKSYLGCRKCKIRPAVEENHTMMWTSEVEYECLNCVEVELTRRAKTLIDAHTPTEMEVG